MCQPPVQVVAPLVRQRQAPVADHVAHLHDLARRGHGAALWQALTLSNDNNDLVTVLNTTRDGQGRTLLHTAAIYLQWKLVDQILEQVTIRSMPSRRRKEVLQMTDQGQYSVLHWAVAMGQTAWVQKHLRNDWPMDDDDDDDDAPSMAISLLHTAIQYDRTDLVRFLWIRRRRHLHNRHKAAVTRGGDSHTRSETVWHVAARYGRLGLAQWMWEQQSLQEKAQEPWLARTESGGQTPLHLAVAHGHFAMAQWLVQCCPEALLVRDKDGCPPWRAVATPSQSSARHHPATTSTTSCAFALLRANPAALL